MQPTLKEKKERSEKFPPNSVQATKIAERVLNFTVMDVKLLPVAGNKGFQLIISHLELQYNMARWKYLSETVPPELHGKVWKHMLEKIKDAKSLSFTTDIWGSDVYSPLCI